MRGALAGGVICCLCAAAGAGFIFQDARIDPFPVAADEVDQLPLAIAAFEKGDLDECERLLTQARAARAELPPAGLMLARMFLASNNTAEAQRRLDALAVTDSDEPEVYASLGELALLQGRVTDAWLEYEKSGRLPLPSSWSEPRRLSFRRELVLKQGEVLELRGDWPAAEQLYAGWLQGESNVAVQLGLARSLILQDRVPEAHGVLDSARKEDPKIPESRLLTALICEQHGRPEQAEQWFRAATTDDDASDEARLEYARWLIVRGQAAEALAQLKRVAPEGEVERRQRFLSGLADRVAGDAAAAEQQFAALHQSDVTDWEAADQLALVLIESPDEVKRARALQLAETNARQRTDQAVPLSTLGWINLRLGALDRAEELLARAAALAPQDPQVAYYVAQLLDVRGRKTEAAELLTQARSMRGFLAQRADLDSAEEGDQPMP